MSKVNCKATAEGRRTSGAANSGEPAKLALRLLDITFVLKPKSQRRTQPSEPINTFAGCERVQADKIVHTRADYVCMLVSTFACAYL